MLKKFNFNIKEYGTKEFNNAVIYCAKNNNSVTKAAAMLGVKYDTFRKYAKNLGVFEPNQSGKGTHKKPVNKIPLKEILVGKYPHYGCSKLRKRLIDEGIKEERCETCGITNWNGTKLNFELHHIDNDRTNHLLENLKILCPNCHSQTEYFRRSKPA